MPRAGGFIPCIPPIGTLFKILRHPLAPLYTAADYLKAMGEALAILFVVVWTVTYISRPKYHGEFIVDVNPLRDRIGFNNLCVGFDTTPAAYFGTFCWMFVSLPRCALRVGRRRERALPYR